MSHHRTPEKRAASQREAASAFDKDRAALDVDQHEVASALGCSETLVRKMLCRADATTLDVADLALMAEAAPNVRAVGEETIRRLAALYGCTLVVVEGVASSPVVAAADHAAHAASFSRDVAVALADGRVDPAERSMLDVGQRNVDAAAARQRSSLKEHLDA